MRFLLLLTLLAPAAFAGAGEISFALVGDLMPGSDHPSRDWLPTNAFALLAPASAILTNVDLALGNLEGALAEAPVAKKGKHSFSFRLPPSMAETFRQAGFKGLNLANNHSLDAGALGVVQATNLLAAKGILPIGMKDHLVFAQVKGKKIGFLGFSPYYPHNNMTDLESARLTIRSNALKCDLLIVSFHGGAEGEGVTNVPRVGETYYGENRGDVFRFARMAVDEGAALVFGHGPHVLRGLEIYKDRLIAYSLGNFLGHRQFNVSRGFGTSCILEAQLDGRGRLVRGRIHPFVLSVTGPTVPDPEKRAIPLMQGLSRADFPETAPVFGEDGAFTPRPRP
ncbi:MAG: CapA family protein [Spirochaetes bacterium]|nr:CapA family protein [Spirochaetota bacterium]